MVKFIIGTAGSGKSTEIMKMIDRECDKEKDICIIVPEQFSYEFDKNLYRYIGARKFNRIFSSTFTALARQLFQLYGDSNRTGRYADETARMILIYQAIKSALYDPESHRFFEKQAAHKGFAEELLKFITELKQSGVTYEELREKAVFLDTKLMQKTEDIALIYLEYERLMNEYGFKDHLDDIKEAAAIANREGYFKGKSVYIDEFESFTGDQLEFIKTIAASAENLCIALRTDDVNAGEFTLFETVNHTYREIVSICREIGKEHIVKECRESYRYKNKDIAYLSENILRNKNVSEEIPDLKAENIRIFEAKDFYSEADYVCAAIKRLICSDKSLKYSDIAVISNDIASYADILETAFERYDIPYFLSLEKQVLHSSIMIFVSTLLNIMTGRKYSSEKLFRYMKCGMLDISLTEVSMLENYIYKWGIEGDIWLKEFTAPDENIEELEKLRKSVIEPLECLRHTLSKQNTAEEYCSSIYDFLSNCGAERNLSRIINQLILENKDYSASELKRLWAYLMDIFDSIYNTLGKTKITFSEFRRITDSLIGRITYSLPPQTLDSVTAASARTARLNSPKVIFVMGANEGSFPNTVSLHGIFSETDKKSLSVQGIEISRRLPELIAAERLIIYKSLSAASEKVFLTYSLSDLSGQAKYPAPVIDSIIKMFGDAQIRVSEESMTPDFYAVTIKSAFYRYMQDMKINSPETSAIKKILYGNSEYLRKLTHIISRTRQKQTYKISTALVEKLKNFEPMSISPSSFELYNKCHFWYFCQECLNIAVREKIDLNVRHSGNIIHECFYNIISSRSKEDFVKLSYEQLESEINKSASDYLESSMGGEFAKNSRFGLEFKKLSERLTKVFVHTQQELMTSSFEPKYFEVKLWEENIQSSLYLPFGEGKNLRFGGIIDRVDICSIGDEKYVRIVDYKSSGKTIDEYTLSNGINMQMLLYLFAITGERGIFKDCKPAGVLYSPVVIPSIKTEDSKINTENQAVIDSGLKTTGLVLSDRNVLEAMEHDIKGRYIPVKLNKQNEIDERSSCITTEAFSELEKYSYKKLQQMAESVYSGDADANPLVNNINQAPCSYCPFRSVCGNNLKRYRSAKKADTTEASEILAQKTKKEDNENGLD